MTRPCLAQPQPRSPEAPGAKGSLGHRAPHPPRVGAQRQTQAGCPLALAGQVTCENRCDQSKGRAGPHPLPKVKFRALGTTHDGAGAGKGLMKNTEVWLMELRGWE